MKPYFASRWKREQLDSHWFDFETLWNLKIPSIDEANTNRGGTSTVSCMTINLVGGKTKKLMVKRQCNHTSRTFLHPIRGVPTFQKELINIFRYIKHGIPTLTPVFFEERIGPGEVRAILVTEFLEGYIPLDEWYAGHREAVGKEWQLKKRVVFKAVADLVRKIHDCGLMHNCLYPKHIFIKTGEFGAHARIIDLEKSRRPRIGGGHRTRDLETLHRRLHGCRYTDRLRFVLLYLQQEHLDERAKKFCRKLLKRTQRKQPGGA